MTLPAIFVYVSTPSSMNTESIVGFLGNVPLWQRLPTSSLKIIAQIVVVKRYDRGEYVVHEDQDVNGVYFILEGEAQVLGSAGEENCSVFLLKRFDFFGCGIFGSAYSADVVALSELTCLLLMSDHCALLETKPIWDSDKELETHCLVERILDMDPLDLNLFRGFTLPNAPTFGKVFGGQLVGQVCGSIVLDQLFLARAQGITKTKLQLKILLHGQIIQFCEPNYSTEQNKVSSKSSCRMKYWFRAKGKLSDDQALHRCVVAYASDLIFACISLNPQRRKGMSVAALSLDHSMWFHRPLRADDWLLFVMVSPTAFESLGFASGEMFNRKGELVVSLTQKALLKEAVTIKSTFGAKL